MAGVLTSDVVAEALRWLLLVVVLTAATVTPALYRRSGDTNPIPWAYFATACLVYAANLSVILAGDDHVIEGWARAAFSTLNILVISSGVWITYRAVSRRGC